MKHDHSHEHDHGNHKSKLTWILVLTVTYMVAEVIGGILSGSLALVADAGHMAIDSLAVVLSLFAAWIAHKPATDQKTYGYYRAEILAALLNGSTLIAISFWIFYEAWNRLNSPHEVQGEIMGMIALGGLIVNLISLLMLHRGHSHSLNVRGIWLHLLTDTLGSVSAIVASFLVWKFGWVNADPIISIAIAVLILFGSWKLVSDCVNVLLEGVPKELQLMEVRKSIEGVKGVKSIHDLHVWTVTSGVNSLSAHVRLEKGFKHADILQAVTEVIAKRFGIHHTTIQIETEEFSHTGESDQTCSLGH